MRLVGNVNSQQREIRTTAHSLFANPSFDTFARGRDRVQSRNRSSVVNDSVHSGVESHHLPQPIKYNFFELSRSWRSAPEHRLVIKRRAQQLTKDAGRRS